MKRPMVVGALLGVTLIAGVWGRAGAEPYNHVQDGTLEGSAVWTGWANYGGWSPTGNPGGTFILNSDGSSGSDPWLAQFVGGLTPGATYRLTGQYSNHHNYGSKGPNTFAVDVGDDDGAVDDTRTFDYPGDGVWGTFSWDVVAPDQDLFIRFRAEIGGDDTDYKIDNISLVEVEGAAVPEPASLLLLGGGLAGLVRLRRGRSKE